MSFEKLNRADREHFSYREVDTSTGKTKQAVGIEQDPLSPVPVEVIGGIIKPLSIEGKVTQVTLNDTTWVKLPATPLADRSAISVQNNTSTNIKINYVNSVGYIGMTIYPGGERSYDITDDIEIYGRSEAGNQTVEVEEIS